MLHQRVIFLDRDGVINRDSPDYVKSWAEFEFLPGSLKALRLLSAANRRLFVITNQSVINRGMVPVQVLDHTHDCLRRAVAASGARIEDIFYCPHRPDENCDCRKPRPGLILQAAARYGIDPADSLMIGDSAKDILCGRHAGCAATILVRTGNGRDAEKDLGRQHNSADYVVADLFHAARLIICDSPASARDGY